MRGLEKNGEFSHIYIFFDIEREDSAFYVHDRTIIIMIIIDLVLN